MRGDSGDAGGNSKANVLEVAQLFHHSVYLPGIRSLRVENGFGIVEEQDHLHRGQEWSQRSQVIRVFDACTNNLRESGEEIDTRGCELVTTNEATVIAKPGLDPIVVEDSEGDGRFPDAPCTDESNRFEVFSETDDLLDQFSASETCPGLRGRRFSQRDTTKT